MPQVNLTRPGIEPPSLQEQAQTEASAQAFENLLQSEEMVADPAAFQPRFGSASQPPAQQEATPATPL